MINQSLSLLQILQEASAKEILASLQRKYPKRLSDVEAISNSGNPPATWPTIMRLLDKANEPVQEVLSLVAAFNKARAKLPKKDLSLYDSLAEVQTAIESLAPSQTSIRNDIKGQVEKVYEDDKFVVVYPHSKEASCVWGKGTTWCTARTQSTNYFPYYAGAGNKLYYLITKGLDPKENPKAKMSLGFNPSGKFTGDQDGGLSVDANNGGIGMSDVINHLLEYTDDVTAKKIINAVKSHAQHGGDHPLKGFYEKAALDPAAHRKFFEDAYNGVTPEPYIALLLLSDARKEEHFYPLFFFDMCVYLNELLKKYDVANEAFSELATSPNLYTMNGWTFPDDINQGELTKYIQDASWLLELGFSKLESYLKTPVVKFVNSIPVALHMIETGNLDQREMRLIYAAKFLNKEQFHRAIRESALDISLDAETRGKYQQLIELFVAESAENFDTHTEILLFSPDVNGTPDSKLSTWFFQIRSAGAGISPQTLNKVITQFILPNLETLIGSRRRNISPSEIARHITAVLGWDPNVIDQSYDAVAQLLFALGFEKYPATNELKDLADKLLAIGIMHLDSAKYQVVQRILDACTDLRRREAMEVVSDTIDFVNTDFKGGDVALVHGIMRKLAEIARRHDTEYEVGRSMPAYATRWWTSPYLPPEYVTFKSTYKPEDPRNPFFPWPPPGLSTTQQTATTTLAEMLFGR
jgi:hypothetical protein